MALYRKPAPYRKPQTYRGNETAVPVVPPALFNTTVMPFQDAADHQADTTFAWQQATPQSDRAAMRWKRLDPIARAIAMVWQQGQAQGFDAAMPWTQATPYAVDGRHPWLQADPHSARTVTPWEQFARKLAEHIGMPWIVPDQHQTAAALAWGTLAARSARVSTLWRQLAARGAYVALPWGRGHNFQTGYHTPWVTPPDGGPGSSLVFPDLPVYIMIPTITAVVIDGGADLKPLSVTISGDVDSFDWSFEMQIPAETFPLVNPIVNSEPVAIRVTVNGFVWSFIVDDYANNRRWGGRGYTIRGGSRSRLLGGDFAPTRTLLQADDYNAAQLADHEVASTGWTVIWDAVDWLVPGGTFTYTDMTPIAALQQLAASVGATLETDPDALEIHVVPRYPVKPWEWGTATPYAIVPAAILDQMAGEWGRGNDANGIYVYPANSTSGAFVRITGTGGVVELPMVVDPLLTDAGAQAQRGWQALAAAGRKSREQAVIPLFPAPASPAFIPLRKLLQATDENGDTWMCQVMSNSITGTRNGSAISVRQTLGLERQFRA